MKQLLFIAICLLVLFFCSACKKVWPSNIRPLNKECQPNYPECFYQYDYKAFSSNMVLPTEQTIILFYPDSTFHWHYLFYRGRKYYKYQGRYSITKPNILRLFIEKDSSQRKQLNIIKNKAHFYEIPKSKPGPWSYPSPYVWSFPRDYGRANEYYYLDPLLNSYLKQGVNMDSLLKQEHQWIVDSLQRTND